MDILVQFLFIFPVREWPMFYFQPKNQNKQIRKEEYFGGMDRDAPS